MRCYVMEVPDQMTQQHKSLSCSRGTQFENCHPPLGVSRLWLCIALLAKAKNHISTMMEHEHVTTCRVDIKVLLGFVVVFSIVTV